MDSFSIFIIFTPPPTHLIQNLFSLRYLEGRLRIYMRVIDFLYSLLVLHKLPVSKHFFVGQILVRIFLLVDFLNFLVMQVDPR